MDANKELQKLITKKLGKNNLFMVRHGQSIYNLENKFTGWQDVNLTDLGVNQAKEAGEILKLIRFDCCFTSNLKRAKITLEHILYRINQPDSLKLLPHLYMENIRLQEQVTMLHIATLGVESFDVLLGME